MSVSRPQVTFALVRRSEVASDRPVYVISVAAGIVEVHPRMLRIYESEGLLDPSRTPAHTRMYSEEDLARVRWIRHLTRQHGINLAGIKMLLDIAARQGVTLEQLLPCGTQSDE
jgi:MerR family transcriptional regulator/heat shock protein HspR